jgi:hypothetical protein
VERTNASVIVFTNLQMRRLQEGVKELKALVLEIDVGRVEKKQAKRHKVVLLPPPIFRVKGERAVCDQLAENLGQRIESKVSSLTEGKIPHM